MRAGCVIALVGWLASFAAAAEQEFPYTAYIARRQAAVRSGPGRNYYATDKLTAGQAVEVYRHQDDWCAIRPPTGSFSWVKAEELRIGREGVGIVLVEGAASRVGSRTSDLRDVIQVRLERGEQVEVLDAVQVSNDNGVEFYCKISPPSGEFRWVHKDDISREKLTGEPNVGLDKGRAAGGDSDDQRDDRDNDSTGARSDRWGSWIRSRGSEHDETVDANLASNLQSTRPSEARRTIALSEGDDPVRARPKADSGIELSSSNAAGLSIADRIDRELSQIVVHEPAQWNLDEVRRRVDEAIEKTATASETRKLRELQERIAKFDDIRRRSIALATPETKAADIDHVAPIDAHEAVASAPGAGIAPSLEQSPKSDGDRYDGVGKLTPVVSQRPNAPRYALVNRANEVVSFVSPAPGVNLRAYEGQYVGITGQRGYMPELKKPHVTALRINSLESGESRLARRRTKP